MANWYFLNSLKRHYLLLTVNYSNFFIFYTNIGSYNRLVHVYTNFLICASNMHLQYWLLHIVECIYKIKYKYDTQMFTIELFYNNTSKWCLSNRIIVYSVKTICKYNKYKHNSIKFKHLKTLLKWCRVGIKHLKKGNNMITTALFMNNFINTASCYLIWHGHETYYLHR